jgi:hypothetical protein
MKHSIFYSWQSDLNGRVTRSFIESALERVARSIAKDDTVRVEPVVDRDTAGLSGSPAIASSIADKISRSDVFVCDVSIVNTESQQRRTPNPNVLVELGYASAVLGWDRVIMVQNTAFGGPEDLPFDLKGRRVVQYNLKPDTLHRSTEKTNLGTQLEDTLRHALDAIISKPQNHKSTMLWWGRWKQESDRAATSGEVTISGVSSGSFIFNIWIADGARGGDISGRARIVASNAAFAHIASGEPNTCEISFRRRFSESHRILDVEEGMGCSGFKGMGATFSGSFIHVPEPLFDGGYLDELDLQELGRITGKYYGALLDRFQYFNSGSGSDEDITRVAYGSVKGMYSTMQSIVALNDAGALWCAFIDNTVVRYFTNVKKDIAKLPKTIEAWRDPFSDKPIVYESQPSTSHS